MKTWSPKVFLGLFLLGLSLAAVAAFYVYPFSKLLGKEKIDFDPPSKVGEAADQFLVTPPVLPIYTGLGGEKTGGVPRNAFLTIEKLGIKKIPIRLDIFVDNVRPDYLNALLTSLAHLKGTVYPGEKGNSVIFGHSALSYLYNPKNLQTIFTRLDELKFGDLILVETDLKVFKFQVEKGGLLEEKAAVSDLASRKPRLTLITCYPPGFQSFTYAVRALLLE